MPTGPKAIEQKIQQMLNAWEELAPAKSFGGMTLADFQAIAAPSLAARQLLADLDDQILRETNTRDAHDEVFLAKAQMVVNGVRADPTEGPNSSLYEAMGYTRSSDRKSGLHRKAGGGAAPKP